MNVYAGEEVQSGKRGIYRREKEMDGNDRKRKPLEFSFTTWKMISSKLTISHHSSESVLS